MRSIRFAKVFGLKRNESIKAEVNWSGQRAVVRAGDYGFWIQTPGVDGPAGTIDFAAYGLAIISASFGVRIHVEQPVSRDVVEQMEKLAAGLAVLKLPKTFPLQLSFGSIVDARPASGRNKIICVSGGVDSLAAAIRAKQEDQVTHALLIAGADYKDGSVGFCDLRGRVTTICDRLGLGLEIVSTNIRSMKFNWNMLHAVNLAMCLNVLSARFSSGAYALDNTALQDLARHPWGNSAPLADLLSSRAFPIKAYDQDTNRVGKLRRIAEYDLDLLSLLSVCWRDKSQGGNCGKCTKCVQTRLVFACLGIDEKMAFPYVLPIGQVLDIKTPSNLYAHRGVVIRNAEILDALPDGKVRQEFSRVALRVERQLERKERSMLRFLYAD